MIFYRHPTPAAAPGLCYGRLDLDIAPQGGKEIAAACAEIGPADQVITSPARRARALAAPLAETAGARLIEDPRWRELDFGAWEGRRWFAIDRAESDPWAEDPWTRSPPGGESFAALYARVAEALEAAPKDAVIVAHAGPIRAARMILTGESFDQVFAWRPPFARPIAFERSCA